MNNQSRGPAKRKVKPVEPQSLLDFDLGEGESSDDSDFRIEDHPEESDDYSINTDDEEKKAAAQSESSEESGSDDEEFKGSNKIGEDKPVNDVLEKAKKEFKFPVELANLLICAGCLGSRSDDFNEIVECDGCGVTVHEGCYGVSDTTSESSTVSSASTEPWFCEACKAGVTDPNCELCPNKGGIFKETEVGAWVHLVCALYVPGVAFSEVERLSGVTLFEMAYSRGQRSGLLAEAHSEEAEQADPFYAHCKLHSDKALVKKRKRNWLALQLRTEKRSGQFPEKTCINIHLCAVPTQKMARMLYSSASAMRKFQKKAECMGIDTHALEFQDAQASKENTEALATLTSTRQALQKLYEVIIALCPKITSPPVLEDRPLVPPELPRSTPKVTPQQLQKRQCSECDKTSDSEPEVLEKKVPRRSRIRYSKDGAIITEPHSPTSPPKPGSEKYPKVEKPKLETPENISPIKVTIKPFEFSSDGNESSEVKVKKEKKIKKSKQREHASASAGEGESPSKKVHKRSFTSPTLTNTPLMSITPIVADSPNDSHNENSNASTNVATTKRGDSFLPQNLSFSSLLVEGKERDSKAIESSIESTLANLSSDIATYKANRKRRKEKHRSRYSPDLLRSPSKSHKHKRKKKTQDLENPDPPHPRITIKIKPIPKPDGSLDTQMFYVPTDSNDGPPPAVMKKLSKRSRSERSRRGGSGVSNASAAAATTPLTHCDVCMEAGDYTNLVR
ncbi:hypothetical protein HF086_016779 [Spodoptera exigua]|uniref:PHD finger protein 14 n=1 Tax=Spodoptera exigua TaxID=7107 RepID=A0A922ML71_SPOEX|nr:hypothetical protein HF086_016779 [Spodoptera exigua]